MRIQNVADDAFRRYGKVLEGYDFTELLNSDKTISQIAMDNGFSSSRAFTREFQKRYGILPSEVEREK